MKWLFLILSTMTLLIFIEGCATSRQVETTSNDSLSTEEIVKEQGVPFLLDIPIIGWLFKTNISKKVDNTSNIQSETTSKISTTPDVRLKSNNHEEIGVNESKSHSLSALYTVDFGSYYALVIGITEYQHLPYLKTAGNDARTVAKIFENDYGFEVRLLLNPTRADILITLGKYRRVLTGDDNFLIYYVRTWMAGQSN